MLLNFIKKFNKLFSVDTAIIYISVCCFTWQKYKPHWIDENVINDKTTGERGILGNINHAVKYGVGCS